MAITIPEKLPLKKIRELRGMSRQELAYKSGVGYNTIMFYENDIEALRRSKYSTIEKICKALNVNTSDIFLGNNSD